MSTQMKYTHNNDHDENFEKRDCFERNALSDGISDDSLNEDDPLSLLNDSHRFSQKHQIKSKSNRHSIKKHSKLRKSVSCSFCTLCEVSEFVLSDNDLQFPMRRAASCSMCDWDFEESANFDKVSSTTEDDSMPSVNHIPFHTQSARQTKMISSASNSIGEFESETESDESTKNIEFILDNGMDDSIIDFVQHENDDENETEIEEQAFSSTPIKRRNSYKSAQEIEDTTESSLSRSSPDGIESTSDGFKTDINYNLISNYDDNIFDTKTYKTSKDKMIKFESKQNKSFKKKFSFKNSKKTSAKQKSTATKEFDDIFGKVQITPQSSVDQAEEEDQFNLSGHRLNATADHIDSKNYDIDFDKYSITDDDKLNLKSRKAGRMFNRLLPQRRSLFNKKKTNLNVNKSRSVEVLYTNELMQQNGIDGKLKKALSTLDLSSGMLYYEDNEEVSTHVNEQWIKYLNKIDGMTILGGNPTLRFVWHQIASYQNELLQPFEDFLKTMIDQLQQAYIKCQDLESIISVKNETKEKDTIKLYDDIELAIQQERLQMHDQQVERDEQLRFETKRIIELKDSEIQDIMKQNEECYDTIERLTNENDDLKLLKAKDDMQMNQLLTNENHMRKENNILIEENEDLRNQLESLDNTVRTLQEHIVQVNKIAEVDKENYKQCLQQYQDVLEEKEYLDVNIKNLTAELNDSKTHNKSLLEQMSFNNSQMSSFNTSTYDLSSTPTRLPDRKNSVDYEDFEYDEKDSNESLNDELGNSNTPCIQTPTGITSIKLTVDENGVAKTLHKNLFNKHRQTKSILPSYRKPVHSAVQSPIRFASENQSEFKVIFTGDANVGKTSLIRRIHSGKFRQKREATIEADYYLKTVCCNGRNVPLKLWDTLGQERFKSIPPSYFRRSDVVILMYDIEEEVSFLNARQWIRTIHDHTDENIFLILVGNKSDMHYRRAVQSERGKKLANHHDAMFIETSAKSGENIDQLCQMIASSLLERDDTVIIRNDFENSLCSMSYSQRKGRQSTCCQ